jgi:hypothetical protein
MAGACKGRRKSVKGYLVKKDVFSVSAKTVRRLVGENPVRVYSVLGTELRPKLHSN